MLGHPFEIKNGILGANRDIVFQLIGLMYYRADKITQNLIGMCGECVYWINHPYFLYYRNPEINLKKQIIPNHKLEEKKWVDINNTAIVFKIRLQRFGKYGSVFANVIIKKMILECTIKVEIHSNFKDPAMYIGVATPSQVNEMMLWPIGPPDCGAGLELTSSTSRVGCNGFWSLYFKEGGLKNLSSVTAVVNQMNNKNFENGGKMSFYREGKMIPHVITNIPSEGVHFGFSSWESSFTIHIMSLHKVCAPPPPVPSVGGGTTRTTEANRCEEMKCVAYNFAGGFENRSYDQRDEEGEKISDIEKYYV